MAQLINNNGEAIAAALNPPNKTPTKQQATAAIRKLELIDPDAIVPLEYRCLVRVATVEDMTDGGIFKPESFFEKEIFAKTEATFISCGDEAFTNSRGEYIENKPEAGERILTSKYAGNPYRDKDNNLYRFCNDKDVTAIIQGD